MRKDIGYVIKFHRQRKNMTQSELSEGIISVSYLSKIENGSAIPPADVVEFLLNKLEVEIDTHKNKEAEIEQVCNDWFISLFNRDIDTSVELYEQVEEMKNFITDNRLLNLLEIHKIRYYLILNNLEQANITLNKVKKIENNFDTAATYYWLKFQGLYFFKKSLFKKALEYYLSAQKYVGSSTYLSIIEEEHDLDYMIALSASYSKKTYLVYKHGHKALHYYQRKVYLKKAAKCHILLGITEVRTQDYEDAMESFRSAVKIAKTLNNNNILAISLQNMGNLYSIMNNSCESINYYKQSYKLRDEDNKRIISITSLMREYYKLQEFEKAKYWLQAGLEIIDRLDTVSIYSYELQVYNHLINGINTSVFEDLLLQKILPYLDRREQHEEKVPFLEILATYYFNQRKYKLSATHYREALKIINNQK